MTEYDNGYHVLLRSSYQKVQFRTAAFI